MWRMGVPVATPVRLADVTAGIHSLLGANTDNPDLQQELRDLSGGVPARLLNSGRAALYATLEAMKQVNSRDQVVIPAFICPSVARAVVKAGLQPVLCDVSRSHFGIDAEALKNSLSQRTLAVITTHLFGYPTDVAPILDLAHAAGAMVVEDAAQAFGATWNSQPVGTMADAGVFSFGMSKVIYAVGGGLILLKNGELAGPLDLVLKRLRVPPWRCQAAEMLKFAAVAVLVRFHHLGPIAQIWGGRLRGKHDADDFGVSAHAPSQAAVAHRLIRRLAEITETRRRNALYLLERLSGLSGITLPQTPLNSGPAFLRLPVVVEDLASKTSLLRGLRARGINVSEMYERRAYEAVCGLAGRRTACPQTEYLAERMVNLPTHPYLTTQELEDSVAAFREVFR